MSKFNFKRKYRCFNQGPEINRKWELPTNHNKTN